MGCAQSALVKAIKAALGGDEELYAFPDNPLYQAEDVKVYNLSIPVKPAAVTYPKTAQQVAAIIKCATDAGLKVQPRSGGHSYANFCLGGVDGAVVIDLKHFQKFEMNRETWRATAGGGTLLKDLTQRMHDAGNRAMAHGICPQVGLGGHATIGGLGPSSRLWGAALDHVEEIEVVLADASIKRASDTENADIFWAIKGAGASFGVVTEFVLRTEPEPGEAVQYSYSFTFGSYKEAAPTFKAWQAFIADPNLTRNFASEVIFTEAGMIISGTYFGTKDEYDNFDMDSKFPGHQSKKTVVFKDWLGLVSHWAEGILLLLGGGVSAPMFTKSMTLNGLNLIPDDAIDKILAYMDSVNKGTLIWFVIFDLAGGKINDIPQEATAYAHRDALFYIQSYAIAFPKIPDTTKDFLRGLNSLIKAEMPNAADFGAYPGYVDPELEHPQQEYWRTNLPRLEQIKALVDPGDVFHNPQSVRPAGGINGAANVNQHVNRTVKAAAQQSRSLKLGDLFKDKRLITGQQRQNRKILGNVRVQPVEEE